MFSGRINAEDFVFAKEVRLGEYRTATPPCGAVVAERAVAIDHRAQVMTLNPKGPKGPKDPKC